MPDQEQQNNSAASSDNVAASVAVEIKGAEDNSGVQPKDESPLTSPNPPQPPVEDEAPQAPQGEQLDMMKVDEEASKAARAAELEKDRQGALGEKCLYHAADGKGGMKAHAAIVSDYDVESGEATLTIFGPQGPYVKPGVKPSRSPQVGCLTV